MLKMLRKNTKLIIWAVIISFALWGGYSVGSGLKKGSRFAGEVFGKGVPHKEFDFFYRASQIFSFTDKTIEDPEILRQIAWQHLIYSREAKARKIEVSDEEVRQRMTELLKAHGLENPTQEAYENWLRRTIRETPRDFEEKIREFIRIQKLIQPLLNQSPEPPSPEELQKQFLWDRGALAFRAVRFPTREEADAFYARVKDPKNWDVETVNFTGKLETSNLAILRTFLVHWRLSEQDILRLYEAGSNHISEPLAAKNEFVVFFITDKKEADPKEFETWKAKYLEALGRKNFAKWAMELRLRANLKDYLPGPADKKK
ncbi:MAG: SurA N-terminal domain-containing protein [Candidatus Omnitrophica bacterium]|nr:SurA N-terminal domain-containing protein [Candidatus Omnitrophota bacterium]